MTRQAAVVVAKVFAICAVSAALWTALALLVVRGVHVAKWVGWLS